MNRNDIKTASAPVLKKHGVIRAALFGSVARNEQTNGSDVDFVVEFEDGRSLFDLGGLKIDLEELLHTSVDVVTYDSLHPLLKGSIISEQDVIYEASAPALH